MSAPEKAERKRLEAGTTVGRYKVIGHLADGEAGSIYLAEPVGAGARRKVALRVIHPDRRADEELSWTFIDETRKALRLHHPNVVQTLDLVRTDEHLGAAHEYAPGMPVFALYPNGPLKMEVTPELVAYIGAEAAAGLHHAHTLKDGKGNAVSAVHGDVCPSNVRVGFDGRIRVADFGMARALERLGKVEAPHGPNAYAAPEQIGSNEFDGRADVWGLGVVLWELLARYRLFRRDSDEETAKAVREAEIPPLEEVRDDVPEEIESAIRKALERDIDKRWPEAKDLQQALRLALPRNLDPVRQPLLAALKPHREEYAERYKDLLGDDARTIPSLGLGLGRLPATPAPAKSSLRLASPAASSLFAKKVGGEPAQTKAAEPAQTKAAEPAQTKAAEPGPVLPPPVLPPIPPKEALAKDAEEKPAPPADDDEIEVDVALPSLPSSELATAPPAEPTPAQAQAVPPPPPPPGASPRPAAGDVPEPALDAGARARRLRLFMIVGGAALLLLILLIGFGSGDGDEETGEGATSAEEGAEITKAPPVVASKAPATTSPTKAATAAPETAAPPPETAAPAAERVSLRIEANRAQAWAEVDGGERRTLPVELADVERGKEIRIRAGAEGCRERTVRAVAGEEPVVRITLARLDSQGGSGSSSRPRTSRPPPKKGLAKNPFGD